MTRVVSSISFSPSFGFLAPDLAFRIVKPIFRHLLHGCGMTVDGRSRLSYHRPMVDRCIGVFAIPMIAVTDHPGVIDIAIPDAHTDPQAVAIPVKEAWSFWGHPNHPLSWFLQTMFAFMP
jgi:hypothetical protein